MPIILSPALVYKHTYKCHDVVYKLSVPIRFSAYKLPHIIIIIVRHTMSSSEGITLEKSLEGFVALHENILYVKNQAILMRDDEEFRRDQKSVVLISGGNGRDEIKLHANFLPNNFLLLTHFKVDLDMSRFP